MNISIKIF